MAGPPFKTLLPVILALIVVGGLAFGLQLRLRDPNSSPVLPAEDPYTHMALVREHLRDGKLDPLNDPGTLYPPGMHALMAATIVYTGADLYDVARFLPTLLGVLGLAGLAVLVARFESLGAAAAAVLAMAIAPEAIFRSTMLSPTAVDLALLPFLAYAVIELLQGKLAWAGAVGVMAAFLLFAHPWIFGILGISGLVLVLFATLIPWPTSRGPLPTAWGLVATVAIIGTGLALSMLRCWGACGPGFRDVLGPEQVRLMEMIAYVVLLLSLLPLVAKASKPHAFESLLPAQRRPASFAFRLAVSQVLLIGVIALFLVAQSNGMPEFVDLPVMFGWPIIVAACVGLAALPFRPTPAGHVGAAIALATYPFVIFDPLASPFWSHRTAVYLGVGLVILAGVAVAALAQAAVVLASRMPASAGAGAAPGARRSRMAMLAVTGVVLVVAVAGGAYAATPGQYAGGWYRLYEPCEFSGLQTVAGLAQSEPHMLVITGTWESKLILSALADDASRLWYKPEFFTDPSVRDDAIRLQAEKGGPIVVVIDSKLATEHPEIDASFLQFSPWTPVATFCSTPTGTGTALQAYTVER